MADQNWFRNETWTDEIEARFFEKLRRARANNQGQYLRIQAYHLQTIAPEVSLRLIEHFFRLADRFDEASAYLARAKAYQKLGKIEDSIQAFHDALATEEARPSIQTNAWLDFAIMVVTLGRVELYDEVVELIDKRWKQAVFPVQHFRQFAALAIIARDRGDLQKAKELALKAMESAERNHSGLSNHASIGLLGDGLPDVRATMQEIIEGKGRNSIFTSLRRLSSHLR
jgi:tetratricopeptide (TPR) repeat protein